ncbi:MAG: hypothetical protein SCJ93_04460 [Bacillota bacterium]|nr:hypothetical protein [Bacillota bacterium]
MINFTAEYRRSGKTNIVFYHYLQHLIADEAVRLSYDHPEWTAEECLEEAKSIIKEIYN